MNRNLPNQLTVGRVALAIAFFVLLGLYDAQPDQTSGMGTGAWLLTGAFVLYILAGISDVLDGYLARKWNVTSAFGRIIDPFVDKILVVGAFTMLAGSNFVLDAASTELEHSLHHWITGGMASGVQAWMVVAILGREFVVSAIRGYSESQGMKFPATSAGKIKMFVQSVTICVILGQLAWLIDSPAAAVLKIALVWLTVAVTIASSLVYLGRARKLLLGRPPGEEVNA